MGILGHLGECWVFPIIINGPFPWPVLTGAERDLARTLRAGTRLSHLEEVLHCNSAEVGHQLRQLQRVLGAHSVAELRALLALQEGATDSSPGRNLRNAR